MAVDGALVGLITPDAGGDRWSGYVGRLRFAGRTLTEIADLNNTGCVSVACTPECDDRTFCNLCADPLCAAHALHETYDAPHQCESSGPVHAGCHADPSLSYCTC